MNVYLTFDVEIWCDGWKDLDARFPAQFERYVYGRSPEGDYALPKTLEILDCDGLEQVPRNSDVDLPITLLDGGPEVAAKLTGRGLAWDFNIWKLR